MALSHKLYKNYSISNVMATIVVSNTQLPRAIPAGFPTEKQHTKTVANFADQLGAPHERD
jgi:hypothetical protein